MQFLYIVAGIPNGEGTDFRKATIIGIYNNPQNAQHMRSLLEINKYFDMYVTIYEIPYVPDFLNSNKYISEYVKDRKPKKEILKFTFVIIRTHRTFSGYKIVKSNVESVAYDSKIKLDRAEIVYYEDYHKAKLTIYCDTKVRPITMKERIFNRFCINDHKLRFVD